MSGEPEAPSMSPASSVTTRARPGRVRGAAGPRETSRARAVPSPPRRCRGRGDRRVLASRGSRRRPDTRRRSPRAADVTTPSVGGTGTSRGQGRRACARARPRRPATVRGGLSTMRQSRSPASTPGAPSACAEYRPGLRGRAVRPRVGSPTAPLPARAGDRLLGQPAFYLTLAIAQAVIVIVAIRLFDRYEPEPSGSSAWSPCGARPAPPRSRSRGTAPSRGCSRGTSRSSSGTRSLPRSSKSSRRESRSSSPSSLSGAWRDGSASPSSRASTTGSSTAPRSGSGSR